MNRGQWCHIIVTVAYIYFLVSASNGYVFTAEDKLVTLKSLFLLQFFVIILCHSFGWYDKKSISKQSKFKKHVNRKPKSEW